MNNQKEIAELKKSVEATLAKIKALKSQEVDYSTWWPKKIEVYHAIALNYAPVYDCEALAEYHSQSSVGGLFATKEDRDTFAKVNNRYYELMEGVDRNLCWEVFTYIVSTKSIKVTHSPNHIDQRPRMNTEVAFKLLLEFTTAELKLWILGGAKR